MGVESRANLDIAFDASKNRKIPVTTRRLGKASSTMSKKGAEQLRMGTALAELGRHIGLTDDDIAAIEQMHSSASLPA